MKTTKVFDIEIQRTNITAAELKARADHFNGRAKQDEQPEQDTGDDTTTTAPREIDADMLIKGTAIKFEFAGYKRRPALLFKNSLVIFTDEYPATLDALFRLIQSSECTTQTNTFIAA